MDDAQLAQRFAALEQQVKLLSDQLGVECPPFPGAAASNEAATAPSTGTTGGIPDDVVALARAGHTTKAISMYRMMTGASLLEAKKIVDNL
jgi:large subunit ribosomal protein L7/L12